MEREVIFMGKMSEVALYGDNLPLKSETQEFSLSVDELKKRKMWVLWRRVERDGKSTKMPINAYTGQGQNPTPQQHGVPTSKQTKLSRSIIVTAWE